MSRTSSVTGVVPLSSSAAQLKSTSSSVLEIIKDYGSDKNCIFCNRSTIDELNLGPLYTRDGVVCHYYCLLFCSNLPQNGSKDTDGILGFLTQDILKEIRRVERKTSKNYNFYKCRFCKQPGATIGCYLTKCLKVYHLPCGLQNGVNFRFTSKFESYCQAHSGPKVFKPVVLRRCPICVESLEECCSPIVLGRCCSNSNFHKECIQNFALSAGSHHLKCPTCADKDLFILDVKFQGIFVPEKDADWETESPNAFQELQERYSRCDAQECLCPRGNNWTETDKESIWRLLRCNSCAGSAIHFKCAYSIRVKAKANLSYGSLGQKWSCKICLEVERRLQDEDKENRCTNTNTPLAVLSEDSDEDKIPARSRYNNNDTLNFSDDEDDYSSSSISSDESLFTAHIVNRKISNMTLQTDEEEFSDNSSVSSTGTLFSVVKKQRSGYNGGDEMGETEISQSPISVLSLSGNDADENDLSILSDENNTFSSDRDSSLFSPVEPLRKRVRVTDEPTLPAFKISNANSDDSNAKEIRCYCKGYNDEEPLTECRRCDVSFHQRCQAGLFKKYRKSLQTRCCPKCTDAPALKELLEIPIAGIYIPKGCENTTSKTYYLTLVHKDDYIVRRHDTVYISQGDGQDVESSRILRVEKLWKNRRGTRYISGHFYFRPFETANATTRRFYRKEIFRSLTPTNAEIKMDNVLGRCWILDPITYCRGRPTCTTLEDEKNIFICESWVDPQTNRISAMELAQSLHSICMKPGAFKEFVEKMKIKKDYRVAGAAAGKPGSSSSTTAAVGRHCESHKHLSESGSTDDLIVVLDLD